jgi:hypothetical protein
MYTINGRIRGLAPILFNAFTESTIGNLRAGTTGGTFTDEQRMQEAMEKLHRGPGGDIVLPSWNFKVCLIEGSKMAGLKEGRKSIAPFLLATVFVQGEMTFGKTAPDFIHEVTGRRPPKTGGACLVKRPAFREGWEIPFTLSVVDDRRSPDHIRRALEEAGTLVGLGSWRPEYGRFLVTDWQVAA